MLLSRNSGCKGKKDFWIMNYKPQKTLRVPPGISY